jgi:uncharacterized protein
VIRTISLLVLTLVTVGATPAPTVKIIHANMTLPVPIPTAALADWTADPGRRTVSLDGAGVTLRGWMYPASDARAPVVLLFGGNAYSIATVDAGLRKLASQGATVIEYDYRGFGFSTGTADIETMRRDALRLYDKTASENGNRPVVVFGYSLGTIFASYVAAQRSVRGLVLMAPFASAAEEVAFMAEPGAYALAPDVISVLDVKGNVATSRAPLLIVHGKIDETISFKQGQEDFAASPAVQKTFVALPGVGHNALYLNPLAMTAFKSFLAWLRPAAQ